MLYAAITHNVRLQVSGVRAGEPGQVEALGRLRALGVRAPDSFTRMLAPVAPQPVR